jgi:hypothetical protein
MPRVKFTPLQYMRAEFEVPAEKGYLLGDLLVNGKPLKYGAQMAGKFYLFRLRDFWFPYGTLRHF